MINEKKPQIRVIVRQKSGSCGEYGLKMNVPEIPGFIALEKLPITMSPDYETVYVALDDIASITIKDTDIYYLIDQIPFTRIRVKTET